jgi:hypothetical protein
MMNNIDLQKLCFHSKEQTAYDPQGRRTHYVLIDRDDQFATEDNPLGIIQEEAWWVYLDGGGIVLYRSVSPRFGEFKEIQVRNEFDQIIGYKNSDEIQFALTGEVVNMFPEIHKMLEERL